MSLAELIDRVLADRPRLTLHAETVDPDDMAALTSFFAAHNVAIEQGPPTDTGPTAVLRRDGQRLAAVDLDDLIDYVTMADDTETTPAVVSALSTETAALPAVDRNRVRLSSRQVETGAWRSQDGTIEACFQRLSRFREHSPTETLYRQLGEAGVDVHVFGQPDATVAASPGVTVHERETAAAERTWFVVYRGDTDGALLAEERAPDRYRGFWTFDEDLVAEVASRVRSTFG